MARVLAKEVAQFNTRVVSLCAGTFNTAISDGALGSRNPLPEAYEGSTVDHFIGLILSRKFKANGDKDKGAKAIYKVAVGEGVGAGREEEIYLPIGRDVFPRVQLMRDRFAPSQEVFGDVCDNVYVDTLTALPTRLIPRDDDREVGEVHQICKALLSRHL